MPIHRFAQKLALVLSVFASIAHAQPEFEMGPLSRVIQSGSNSAWTIFNDEGRVRLHNPGGPGDIRYYLVDAVPDEAGRREVSVDIEILPTTIDGYAGLLFGYQEIAESYFLYTIGADDSLSLLFMLEGEFEKVLGRSIHEGDMHKTTGKIRLTLREQGQKLVFLVENQVVLEINSEHLWRGATGIVAAGIGDFQFSGFDVRAGLVPTRREPVSDTLVWQEVRSARFGWVIKRLALPVSWILQPENEEIFASGPDSLTLYHPSGAVFDWSENAETRRALQMSGIAVAPLVPLAEHFDEVMKPELVEAGITIIETYELPEIQALELDFARTSGAIEYDAVVESVEILGVDAQHADGSMSVRVIQQTTIAQGAVVQRLVQYQDLLCSATRFDAEKAAWLRALATAQIDIDQRQADRQDLESTSHVNRLRIANRVAQSRAAYEARLAAMDAASPSRLVAGIYDQIPVYNETLDINKTGRSFRIEANSHYLWFGQDDKYKDTDDPIYDPRLDQRINKNQWNQLQVR